MCCIDGLTESVERLWNGRAQVDGGKAVAVQYECLQFIEGVLEGLGQRSKTIVTDVQH